jgi:exonuclease III
MSSETANPHPINQADQQAVANWPQQPSINEVHNTQAQRDWRDFFARQQANPDRIRNGHRPVQLSVENQRANDPWGDLIEEKQDSMTRVNSLNANGFTLDRRGGQFDAFCRVVKEVQADIVACQEHCLDTTQLIVRSVLYDTLKNHWTRSRLTLGTTPITFNNMYKPGDTMLVSMSHITGRVLSTNSDKWGRWTSQTLRCQHERKLTVISAYQVVPDSPSPEKVTAAEQQRSLLIESQDPLREPRPAFVRDLHQYLQSYLDASEDILILGDFNEVIGRDCNPLISMMSELGLLNLMAVRHDSPPPPRYARGRKCIDYGFATPRVTLALKASGYEAFNERFTTDHRSYFFDIDTDLLFGTSTPTLASPQQRILNSKNVKQATSYIKMVYDYLVNCNAFERAECLSHPGNRHAFAERLDKDMLQACLMAERKLTRFGEPAWSVALDQARRKTNILRKCLSMIELVSTSRRLSRKVMPS